MDFELSATVRIFTSESWPRPTPQESQPLRKDVPMDAIQTLMEQKLAIEKEMADTLRQAALQKRNLEIRIERERQAQVESGLREIREVMAAHNLTESDVLGALDRRNRDASVSSKKKEAEPVEAQGRLAEMRRYFNSF